MPGRTVFTVLEQTAAKAGDAIALYQPTGSKAGKAHRTYSWSDWLKTSRELALGLRALGLKKGEIVLVLSETRAEFYLVDLGIMGAGGVSAALYTAYPITDLVKNLKSASARFLFIEDAKTLDNLTQASDADGVSLPENVILMSGDGPGGITLETLQQKGLDLLQRDAEAWQRMADELSPQRSSNFVFDFGRDGRAEDGTDNPFGRACEYRHGSGGVADWSGGLDGGVPAVSAHCTADCLRTTADAHGDTGLVFRKPGSAA